MCNIVQSHGSHFRKKPLQVSTEPTSTPHPLLKTMEKHPQLAVSTSVGAGSCDPESVLLRSGAGPQSTEKESIKPESLQFDKYNIGFTPVNIHGRPILDTTGTGGWRAALFVFGTNFSSTRLVICTCMRNRKFAGSAHSPSHVNATRIDTLTAVSRINSYRLSFLKHPKWSVSIL